MNTSRRLCIASLLVLGTLSIPVQAQFPFFTNPAEHNLSPTGGNYWIGVECAPADAALRAQLKLPADQGLVIYEVIADSPTNTAGLKRYDLLLTANDKPLGMIGDLIAVVQAAKEGELRLTYLRAGQPHSTVVRPVKRPDWPPQLAAPGAGMKIDPQMLEQALKLLQQGNEVRLVNPGVVITPPPGTGAIGLGATKLPDDMSIIVERRGQQPAKVIVKQGDQTWEATEDKLDTLPPEVRKHVTQQLHAGRNPWLGAVPLLNKLPRIEKQPSGEKSPGDKPSADKDNAKAPQLKETLERARESLRGAPGVEQRLEQLLERLEKLEGRLRGENGSDESK